jgi:hypothetical protein
MKSFHDLRGEYRAAKKRYRRGRCSFEHVYHKRLRYTEASFRRYGRTAQESPLIRGPRRTFVDIETPHPTRLLTPEERVIVRNYLADRYGVC